MKKISIKKLISGVALFGFFIIPATSLAIMDKAILLSSSAPTITSATVNNITTTSATFNGKVNPNGAATTAWFETPSSGQLGLQTLGSGTNPVTLAPYALSGLSPNTSYKFRVVASNVNGITNGSWVSFTTVGVGPTSSAPTITSATVTNITTTSATFNGKVNPNGAATTAWFETPSSGQLGLQTLGSGTNPVTLAPYALSGLSPNTSYKFRVVASNVNGITNGSWVSFTTVGVGPTSSAPTITSATVTNITTTSATFNGKVNPNGAATTAWFETPSSGQLGLQTLGSGTNPVTLAPYALSGLSPNTSYKFRVVASNVNGITNGSWVTFVTLSTIPPNILPTIANAYATPSTTSAILNGAVDPNGINTDAWFETPSSGQLGFQNIGSGNNVSVVLTPYTLTGLTPNTTYTFRVAAQNINGTVYGSWVTFVTLSTIPPNILPAIANAYATPSTTSAILNGAVDPNGINTDAWFETPSSGQLGFQNIGSGNNVSVVLTPYTLTGLTPNTTYTFRVAAQNINGTVYGSWVSFTTLNTSPNSLTLTSISPTSGKLGQTLNITLYGTNFSSNGITSNFGTDITVNSTNFVNSSQLTSNITIPSSASLGAHNVIVTSGGQTTSPQTFTVLKASSGGGGGGGGSVVKKVSVITRSATNITKNSVVLNGLINPNRGSTTAWFEYGTSSYLSSSSQTSRVSLGSGSSSLSFSQGISNLNPSTTYYFRAVGNNSQGIIRGSILSFNTNNIGDIIPDIIIKDENPGNPTEPRIIYQDEYTSDPENILPNNQTNFNDNYFNNRELAASAVYGFGNILPKTALGWLILLVLILVLLIIARELYADYAKQKSRHKVSANHIENLPT